MSELKIATEFKKEYMTGYTGHVPSKIERFGATCGNIQKEILLDKGQHPVNLPHEGFSTLQVYTGMPPIYDKNKIIYGNHSRRGANWMCGPKHMINE